MIRIIPVKTAYPCRVIVFEQVLLIEAVGADRAASWSLRQGLQVPGQFSVFTRRFFFVFFLFLRF